MNVPNDPTFIAFCDGAQKKEQLVAYIAFCLYKAAEHEYCDSYRAANKKPPNSREFKAWGDQHGTGRNKAGFFNRAEGLLSEFFAEFSAQLMSKEISGTLEQASREAEQKYLGIIQTHIQTASKAQLGTETTLARMQASIAKLESFWRNVWMNSIAGFISTIIGIVFIGLLAFGLTFKDNVTYNAGSIHITIPTSASAPR